MEGFAKFILGILIAFIGTVINAWATTLIFDWVITPAYGIPHPPFWHLFLLFMLWGAIKVVYDERTENRDWEDTMKYAIMSNLAALMMIGIAWLFSFAML
ncbi:MAG: hypothetical protein ACWGQW_01755 [bacterium]